MKHTKQQLSIIGLELISQAIDTLNYTLDERLADLGIALSDQEKQAIHNMISKEWAKQYSKKIKLGG